MNFKEELKQRKAERELLIRRFLPKEEGGAKRLAEGR